MSMADIYQYPFGIEIYADELQLLTRYGMFIQVCNDWMSEVI